MNRGEESKKNTILFVDDETKALKYFKKGFEKDYAILMAINAEEGWTLVQENSDHLALVISDQRMPGKQGVEFLSQVRKAYPGIIRILTTAYSDLKSAIDAVNQGAIYRYVTKPWDFQELAGILKRATDFYLIQKERDTLLREKLSVIQRLIITDRVQSLAMLGTGLGNLLNNTVSALANFVDLLPRNIQDDQSGSEFSKNPEHWQDLGALAKNESHTMLETGRKIVETVGQFGSGVYEEKALESLVDFGMDLSHGLTSKKGGAIKIELGSDLGKLVVDPLMIRKCFKILIEGMAGLCNPGTCICLKADEINLGDTAGVRIAITAKGQTLEGTHVARLFSILTKDKDIEESHDFLTALFMIHHHGGELLIGRATQKDFGLEVLLPLDCREVEQGLMEEDYLQKLHRHFDTWDALLL